MLTRARAEPSIGRARRALAGLVAALVLAAAVLPIAVAPKTAAAAALAPGALSFAIISDTHWGYSPVVPRVTAVLSAIAATPRLAFAAHLGDVTEAGSTPEFQGFLGATRGLPVPLYAVPGNHDTRWADRGAANFADALGPAWSSRDIGGCHFVFADSTIAGGTHGHFDPALLDWLRKDLDAVTPGMPVFVFVHHPPGLEGFCDNDGDFLAALARRRVEAVFCGHGHKAMGWTYNGVRVVMVGAAMDGAWCRVTVDADAVRVYSCATPPITPLGPAATAETLLYSWPRPVARAPAPTVQLSTPAASTLDYSPDLTRIEVRASVDLPPGAALLRVEARADGGAWVAMARAAGQAAGQATGQAAGSGPWSGTCPLPVIAGAHEVEARCVLASPAGNAWRDIPEGAWYARARFTVSGGPVREAWRIKVKGAAQSAPVVGPAVVYFGSSDGYLNAVSRADGRFLWQYRAQGPVTGSPALAGDTVYFGDATGRVYALNAATGKRLWEQDLGGPVFAGLLCAGGRLFVGSGDHWLRALSARDGHVLWARQLGGAVFERPAVLERTLVVTATDGSVAALDARRGDVLWRTQLGRSVYYTPARCTPLLVPGRVVVVAPGDPQRGGVGVFALDAATGGVAWQTADGAGLSSPCLLPAGACPGGAFALATPRGEVLALSLAGGGRPWTLATGHAMYDAAPVMAGPLCVTPALDGTVFALDPETGVLAWAYRVGAGFVLASPGGAAGSGDVVIATMGGTVVMLRPAAGAR